MQISVPDAVIGLDAGKEVLGNLAQAKLREVARGAWSIEGVDAAMKGRALRRG